MNLLLDFKPIPASSLQSSLTDHDNSSNFNIQTYKNTLTNTLTKLMQA